MGGTCFCKPNLATNLIPFTKHCPSSVPGSLFRDARCNYGRYSGSTDSWTFCQFDGEFCSHYNNDKNRYARSCRPPTYEYNFKKQRLNIKSTTPPTYDFLDYDSSTWFSQWPSDNNPDANKGIPAWDAGSSGCFHGYAEPSMPNRCNCYSSSYYYQHSSTDSYNGVYRGIRCDSMIPLLTITRTEVYQDNADTRMSGTQPAFWSLRSSLDPSVRMYEGKDRIFAFFFLWIIEISISILIHITIKKKK